jgi:hypothetical protein
MITELTQEQKDLLSVYRDKWLKIGLDTTPLDKDKATKAIHKAYECGGLQPPKEIIFTESPLESEKLHRTIKDKNDSVRDSVWNSVWNSVMDSVRDSVMDSVRDSVMDSVWNSVRDSVWNSVGVSVRVSINFSIIKTLCYGNHDADCLSHYNYFQEV